MFNYTTVKNLRDNELKVTISDIKAKALIERYSNLINLLTSQYFLPQEKTVIVEDYGRDLVVTPEYIPFINFNSLKRISYDDSEDILTEEDYNVFDRYIKIVNTDYYNSNIFYPENELYYSFGYNSERYRWEINAVFGWVDPKDSVVTTTLTQELKTNDTSLHLDDVSELEVRDILTINKKNFIANSIDYDTNIVTIDDVGSIATIAVGSEVKCYGKVPLLIEQGVTLLCVNSKKLDRIIGGRITSENIDGYRYTMNATTTGIQEVDLIIENYSRPIHIGSS